jgi:hypothetical protein
MELAMKPIVAELLAAMAADTPFLKEEDLQRARFLVTKIIRNGRERLVIAQQKKQYR